MLYLDANSHVKPIAIKPASEVPWQQEYLRLVIQTPEMTAGIIEQMKPAVTDARKPIIRQEDKPP